MYYRVCPRCGCNLDPGERCDCRDKKEKGRPADTGTTPRTESTRIISAFSPAVKHKEVRAL